MENNEYNRQYTVIAAEIERQKIELEKHRSLTNILNHATLQLQSMKRVVECEYAISVLESLLPKEREMVESAYNDGIKMGESYIQHHGYDNYIDSEQWFSQTYTQDYKTK